MAGRARVFIATSVDGFIAGPNDEIDWLTADGAEDTFTPFFADVGALLMGRATYEVAAGFEGEWPYGDKPVLVATHRELEPKVSSVRAVQGGPEELLAQAKEAAGGRDVYVDGGKLIRSCLDAGLIDEITISIIPIILGAGIPLFAGTEQRHAVELVGARPIGGNLLEMTYRPKRGS